MSATTLQITVDGRALEVPTGTTVAAALLNHGFSVFGRSVQGESRGPLCGMGICFECRVTVDGMAGVRACLVVCEAGMVVETEGAA